MKRALFCFAAICLLPPITQSQNMLTRKEIYKVNCKAVVQIKTDEGFGVGFIVSADGMIMTANHVITTRESKFREYAKDIRVAVFGKPEPYTGTPINAEVSDDQANYDSAIVRIKATNLPHVTLGNWAAVGIGDPVTIIPSFPGYGCILLEGMIAATGAAGTAMGPKPVNTLIFQSPIRNGFSGSPIFDAKGEVVGIEDTKVFGISQVLGEERKSLKAGGDAGIAINGTSIGQTVIELIDNLDQGLISRLGSGVAIDYAKEQQPAAKSQRH